LNLAATAYCDQKEIEDWNCYNCKGYGQNTKEVVYIKDKKLEAAGYVGVNTDHNIIVASFRGTSEPRNWLTNLKIIFTDLKVNGKVVTNERSTVKVHTGFNEATDALLPRFRSAIKDLKNKYPTYSVVFTGHSLGGALASLSAVKLAEESILSWNQTKIVTFGQPRVGNDVFASYLNSKPVEKARVTTRGDIVTISPGLTLGYRHSQHII
ncbi:alpha/beta-hydrolase, partial [Conidiobolus coronatus NRRL 28638]